MFATLRWPEPSSKLEDPDVILIAPDGTWEYTSYNWPEKHVILPAKIGQTYRIVVLAYRPAPQAFTLLVELQTS